MLILIMNFIVHKQCNQVLVLKNLEKDVCFLSHEFKNCFENKLTVIGNTS